MTLQSHTWGVREAAEYFGESPTAFRQKRRIRELAGFPQPQPRLSDHEPLKWIAAEIRAWDVMNRGKAGAGLVAPANDTGPEPPGMTANEGERIARERTGLMGRLAPGLPDRIV